MSCPRYRARRAGFTFVEIMLTLVLLSIAAVPLMTMFSTAVEQTGTIDEIRAALDLGREEVEKIKNLALTEDQIKALGNVVSPPIVLNKTVFYTVRVVDPDEEPLQVTVYVFRDSLSTYPIITLVTVVSK